VGSEGLEPSPSWLRARHAAANTLIPIQMGPEGLEPSPGRLKVCCAAITPRPRQGTWIGLCRVCRRMTCSFRIIFCVARLIARSGVEPLLPPYQSNVLPLHHRALVIYQRIPLSVGTVGIEPTFSCSQDTRAPGALHPEMLSLAPAKTVARMGVEPISPP
jgi:hypothetical protein